MLSNELKLNSVRCPLAPKGGGGGSKTQSVLNLNNNSEITSKRYEIGCQLVLNILITNRKSHTGFRLAPISVTLNDLERHNSSYFALFRGIPCFCGPIASQWLNIDLYCMQNIVFLHFWLKLAHTAARSLCGS